MNLRWLPVHRHCLLHLLLLLMWRGVLPRPLPQPMPPTVAQTIIALLTMAHAGMIGYAIHHEQQTQNLKYVGTGKWGLVCVYYNIFEVLKIA